MDDRKIRPAVWLGVVGSLAALVAVLSFPGSRRAPAPEAETPPTALPIPEAAPRSRMTQQDRSSSRQAPAALPQEPPPFIEGMVWGEIDLREAKALMPDNLYWKFGAPTKDPAVLEEREKEKAGRNEEYGRVLAGDASEDGVRAYYDYRRRLSSDYLEFSEFMSRRYRNSDNKEFVGMLELAMKMHAERLQQLQGELDDALALARARAKVREDWRRQQEEFGPGGGLPTGEDAPQ